MKVIMILPLIFAILFTVINNMVKIVESKTQFKMIAVKERQSNLVWPRANYHYKISQDVFDNNAIMKLIKFR